MLCRDACEGVVLAARAGDGRSGSLYWSIRMWQRAEQRGAGRCAEPRPATHLDQVPRSHLLDLPSKPLRVSFGRIDLILKKGQGM